MRRTRQDEPGKVHLIFFFAKYHPTVPRKKAEDEILDRYRAALETHLIVVPGSCEAVRSLAAEFALGLVSGSHRREILWALNKLDLLKYFKVILGAEDYPKSKPAPDGYQKAMKELGATPEGTVIFEDSQAGIASGRAVGAWVVAITSTNHFGQETAQSHCQIQDFTNVTPEWVRGKFLAPV